MDPSVDDIDLSISDENQKSSSNPLKKKKKTVLKIFGFEMLAPENLNNAGLIFISFIAINFFLLFLLSNFLGN